MSVKATKYNDEFKKVKAILEYSLHLKKDRDILPIVIIKHFEPIMQLNILRIMELLLTSVAMTIVKYDLINVLHNNMISLINGY
jgi:hypothetical protein